MQSLPYKERSGLCGYYLLSLTWPTTSSYTLKLWALIRFCKPLETSLLWLRDLYHNLVPYVRYPGWNVGTEATCKLLWIPSIRTLWNEDTSIKGTIVAAPNDAFLQYWTPEIGTPHYTGPWNGPKGVRIRGAPPQTMISLFNTYVRTSTSQDMLSHQSRVQTSHGYGESGILPYISLWLRNASRV